MCCGPQGACVLPLGQRPGTGGSAERKQADRTREGALLPVQGVLLWGLWLGGGD